jgi:hypothetical protein
MLARRPARAFARLPSASGYRPRRCRRLAALSRQAPPYEEVKESIAWLRYLTLHSAAFACSAYAAVSCSLHQCKLALGFKISFILNSGAKFKLSQVAWDNQNRRAATCEKLAMRPIWRPHRRSCRKSGQPRSHGQQRPWLPCFGALGRGAPSQPENERSPSNMGRRNWSMSIQPVRPRTLSAIVECA